MKGNSAVSAVMVLASVSKIKTRGITQKKLFNHIHERLGSMDDIERQKIIRASECMYIDGSLHFLYDVNKPV